MGFVVGGYLRGRRAADDVFSRRKFFPPTEQDLAARDQELRSHRDAGLLTQMPDPPSGELLSEGQPEAKRQKVDVADEALDQDWEKVEKPDLEAAVDLGASKGNVSEEGELVKASAAEEQSSSALHTAEGGGDRPQSGLLKDW